MESNYEAGERVELKHPYIDSNAEGVFTPSGEILLLIEGPYIVKKYGKTSFVWDVLLPNGMLAKISEDYF